MNKKQITYQIGRIVKGDSARFLIPLAGGLAYISLQSLYHIQGINDYENILSTVAPAVSGAVFLKGNMVVEQLSAKIGTLKDSKNIGNRELYPLENVENVVFADQEDLEMLLEKTSENERIEWGTLIKAHENNGTAIIDGLLDIEEGKRKGLIGKGTRNSICLGISEEFDGQHHYHPDDGAANFTINPIDKYNPKNTINLLSFNIDGESEIVAFNRRYVYVPKNKMRKDELVKAGPKQIMKYLEI